MGVSPWNRIDNEGLSREAATEANMDVSESPPATRACPGGSRASALRNRSEFRVAQRRWNHWDKPEWRFVGIVIMSHLLALRASNVKSIIDYP